MAGDVGGLARMGKKEAGPNPFARESCSSLAYIYP